MCSNQRPVYNAATSFHRLVTYASMPLDNNQSLQLAFSQSIYAIEDNYAFQSAPFNEVKEFIYLTVHRKEKEDNY